MEMISVSNGRCGSDWWSGGSYGHWKEVDVVLKLSHKRNGIVPCHPEEVSYLGRDETFFQEDRTADQVLTKIGDVQAVFKGEDVTIRSYNGY